MADTPPHPLAAVPHGYRDDPAVPGFDDLQPLLVFDGVCNLCSGFVRFVLRRDRAGRFRFAAAQSPLGQALYRHYGLDAREFATNLLIADGRLHARMASFAAVMARLPWPWRALAVAGLLPRPLGDRLYDLVARNRYRWFGRTDQCMVPDAAVRARFIG
jgi:predicted DCC family thiol-disulfide oxidoreductase YuxK